MTLIPFNYNEQQLRVIEIDGEPWFIPADACAILGHSNASQAVAQHVHADDVKRATLTIREGSRDVTRERTLINESGLYASMSAIARRASWVAHIALIIMLTAIGPDSLLIAALGLLVARTLWTLTPKATLS